MGTKHEGTDLGQLWTKAVQDYLKKTGKDLSRDLAARSIGDVMKSTEGSMQSFQGFRHKGDKVDKVRSAFGRHLDGMQKCMKGIETIGAAAGAFPPAMPVSIVFAACGHLLSAFAGVKADYDRVEEFFSQSSRFFERLSIIENKGVDGGALGKAIVRVFSAQLSICAIVEVMIKTKAARFKQWLIALWNMQDPDLAAAFAVMQESIEELGRTVGYASYAEIKNSQALTIEISGKADEIDENIKQFRSQIDQDLRGLYESHLSSRKVLTDGFHAQEALLREVQSTVLKALQGDKSKPDHQEKDKRQQTTKGSGKGDPGDKKFKALRNIKAMFDGEPGIYPNWRDAYKENASQHAEMQEAYVEQTADWLNSDPIFQQWVEGKVPLLWIQGNDGIGKTFIAHKLARRDGGHSTAYFYFREDFPYLQSAHNAVACTALQIAESDTRYAEKVAAKMKEDAKKGFVLPTLDRFFLSVFNGTSQNSEHLYLVFDGLDEAPELQRDLFLRILVQLTEMKSNVHVLVTSRPDSADAFSELNPLVLEVTKEKMIRDMRTLTWNRLNTIGRLRKFSPASKKLIAKKVLRHADGMLYIEHMLRRLSYIGREGAVLKDLSKMPSNLQDLYKLMLDECRRNRSKEQYEALKRLFAWLAFSKRSLSLEEASELVRLIVTEDQFDIEDEIIGRSARILELSRTRNLQEENQTEFDGDENDEDAEENPPAIDEEYRNASLTFQERSLRQYFRAVSVDDSGDEELRTPASAAHLTILKMCCDVLVKSAAILKQADMPVLRVYAMIYWYEHFNELDVGTASDEDVSQVLAAVHKIVSNQNNVAKLFERYVTTSNLYPERSNETTVPWYDRLQGWVVRGSVLPVNMIDDEVRTWAVGLTAAPDEILLPMAKAHVHNWIEEPTQWFIREAYKFAEAALQVSGRYIWLKEDPKKSILSIADAFGEHRRDYKTLRAIGTCLFYAGTELDSEGGDISKSLFEEGREYMRQSVENMDQNDLAKVHTLSTLAALHARNEDRQEAVETINQALDCLETLEPSVDNENEAQDVLDFVCEGLYIDKATHLWQLEKKQDALDAFNAARKAAGEGTIAGYYLDDITKLLDDPELDPSGCQLMETLKSWNDKERFEWFSLNLRFWISTDALGRMYRAAKATGETGLVLQWLDAYGKTLEPRSLLYFNAQSAVAEYQSKVLGNIDKAKEIMRSTLAVHPTVGGSEEDVLNERITEARLELASLIFSQFRESPDPKTKDALLQEMRSLPGTRTDDELRLRDSHVGMLVANMLRIMGPARDYQDTMEQIFQTCINGLEDDVSWNDGDSLRLLAKVLSSLDGLERDARITLSAQFSVLDRSIYENGQRATDNGTEGEDHGSGDEQKDSPSSPIDDELAEQNKLKADSVESFDPVNGSADKNPEQSDSEDNVDSAPKPTDVEHEDEPDENIANFWVGCDGNCGRQLNSWTEPFYLCIICPNTDLCEECHAKRQAWNRGESTSDAWRTYCGKNHHYVKGPMKGWRGVKDGMMRIGEEEIPVKDWVKSLKEERWPKAWEAYWLQQGGLKDIGIGE